MDYEDYKKLQIKLAEETEHTWQRDEDGSIDQFGHDYDMHNGPRCTACGYAYCWHCGELEKKCSAKLSATPQADREG